MMLKIGNEYLTLAGKPVSIDWDAFPSTVSFRAQNLVIPGIYSGGVIELQKGASSYEFDHGYLKLCALYIGGSYGGADGHALTWIFNINDGVDGLFLVRFFNVTEENLGILPTGLYSRIPLISQIDPAPPYEIFIPD